MTVGHKFERSKENVNQLFIILAKQYINIKQTNILYRINIIRGQKQVFLWHQHLCIQCGVVENVVMYAHPTVKQTFIIQIFNIYVYIRFKY